MDTPKPKVQPIVPVNGTFQTDGVSAATTFYRLQETRHHALLTFGVLFLLLALIALGVYLLVVLLPSLSAAPPA